MTMLLQNLTWGLNQRWACVIRLVQQHFPQFTNQNQICIVQVVAEECSPVIEKVCTTVPKETCHKVTS